MMGLRPSKLQIYMKATRCGHRCLRCDSSSKASFVVILTPILDKEDNNASRFSLWHLWWSLRSLVYLSTWENTSTCYSSIASLR